MSPLLTACVLYARLHRHTAGTLRILCPVVGPRPPRTWVALAARDRAVLSAVIQSTDAATVVDGVHKLLTLAVQHWGHPRAKHLRRTMRQLQTGTK